MVGSEKILVEDSYIRLRHQVDLFRRFCTLAVSLGVKEIELKSGTEVDEDLSEAETNLEALEQDLAKHHGAKLSWTRSDKIHDREIVFSSGWVVKVGRGLDLYYKPESWKAIGASDLNYRRCRQTKVDVFRREPKK